METKILLRIAAFLILVHLLGHSIGHFTWDKPSDPKMQDVVTTMKGYSVEFMGATKSMADYYNGYSLIMFGLFGMTVLVLWILSNHATTSQKLVKQMLYPIGLTYVIFGIIEWLYFFPFAAIISILAGIIALSSIAKLSGGKTYDKKY